MNLRIGIGVDAHRTSPQRKLVLGGVEIPAPFGLEAHSDGDVLAHAILDAILGAADLGDKGRHFPPSDPRYKDIRSTLLLTEAMRMLREHGFELVNVDVSVMCEQPKLAPYLAEMKRALAPALGVRESQVSIKGTTLEHLGFTGRGEGIAALAVALIQTTES